MNKINKRSDWIKRLDQMFRVPLASAARQTLYRDMPIEAKEGYKIERRPFAHLELIGRGL